MKIMRKQIAAANWKMNLTLAEGEKLIDDLLKEPNQLSTDQLAIFAVPFPYLLSIQEKLANQTNVFVAAQNCSAQKNGAYTGEVSAEMLKNIKVPYVIIGHSERREYNQETNVVLAEKVNRAFDSGLKPIFCCGESLSIRQSVTQNSYIENQLRDSLFHLSTEQIENFIIAYEPIWAIGTGKTASSEQAQEMHAHIRNVMARKYGAHIAETISILYGGSVKASNAADIFVKPDVDGGLVGGASLIASEFAVIINSLKK
ncbi:MAG: triose-phosphate isomerase [Ferruginibacter sp.]